MRGPRQCLWCGRLIWPWQPVASPRFASTRLELHTSCAARIERGEPSDQASVKAHRSVGSVVVGALVLASLAILILFVLLDVLVWP
jgi:hypothetical protein